MYTFLPRSSGEVTQSHGCTRVFALHVTVFDSVAPSPVTTEIETDGLPEVVSAFSAHLSLAVVHSVSPLHDALVSDND